MIANSGAIIGTFTIYLGLMLAIGVYAYRRTANSSDYFLGGRSLGPWPAALSAGASDMSGWLLLGLPGYAFSSGLESVWLGAGLLIGTWLNWLLVAKRLRTYSIEADDALTLPEFFANRFEDKSNLLQVISAFFILLFFLFYTSSGLVAGGKLFETVFGLDYTLAVIIGTVCVVSYTLFGGFLAVSWTDLVQGLLMAAALVIVPIIAIQSEGGFANLFTALEVKNPELLTIWNDSKGEPLTAIAIISLAAWGLGYFGQPHILARFAAVRSNAEITTARRIAVVWSGLSMVGAILVGLAGIIYVDNQLGGNLGDGEKIFMLLVNAIFHPVVAGILLAAILAAIMSTADSQLLVSSSALAEDFYKQVFRKDASQKQVVMVGRIAVIGLSLVALMLAMNPDSSVLGLVSYAWAGFGAAFGPTLILSLYWKRMNRFGALAGVIVGGLTVVIWKQISGGIFDVYEIVPGIIFAAVSIIIVSLVTAEPSESIKQRFDSYLGKL
ncbi:MAG: sodium/proline symporter PutP [Pseudomonadales bacterium]|jgi:sodium/proline symporter